MTFDEFLKLDKIYSSVYAEINNIYFRLRDASKDNLWTAWSINSLMVSTKNLHYAYKELKVYLDD